MKTLVVLTGPTGVGKTELSLRIAEALGSPVLSCDSRQLYREMPVGTAAPTAEQCARVPHRFIADRSIHDHYSAARFEKDVLNTLEELFITHSTILMTGGSMMYIDAVCKGIDDMPDVDPLIREELNEAHRKYGLEPLLNELRLVDPDYYESVDRKNYKRVIHGLEIWRSTGKRFSDFRTNTVKTRPFSIVKICIDRERSALYQRIDQRVEEMMECGLESEARALYPFRHLNALNTVGYKEMFAHFDGQTSLSEAIEKIKFNTHAYARKQLTWFRRDGQYKWFDANKPEDVIDWLTELALLPAE